MVGVIGSIRKSKLDNMQILPPSGYAESDLKEFAKKTKETDKLHLILESTRIGGHLFSVRLEYEFFPPRSGKNQLFEMAMLKWPLSKDNDGLIWSVMSFPIEFKPDAERMARDCGLRLADGVPTSFFDGKKCTQFPICGDTAFTLEHIKGHPSYGCDQQTHAKLEAEEKAQCEAIFRADQEVMKVEMAQEGYSVDQIIRIIERMNAGDFDYDEKPIGKKS